MHQRVACEAPASSGRAGRTGERQEGIQPKLLFRPPLSQRMTAEDEVCVQVFQKVK